MHAEHDDRRASDSRPMYAPRGFDAVHVRHGHVHHRRRRGCARGQQHAFAPVARLRNHRHVGLPLEQSAQAVADDGVVVSQQDTNRLWHVFRLFHRSGRRERQFGGELGWCRVPGCDSMRNRPPRRRTRSSMPSRPRPRLLRLSKPRRRPAQRTERGPRRCLP